MQTTCKHCGEPVEKDWKKCPACLQPLNAASNCINCGSEIKPHWKQCPYCEKPTQMKDDRHQFSQEIPLQDSSSYNPYVTPSDLSGREQGVKSPTPSPGGTPEGQISLLSQVPDIPEGEILLEQFRIKQKIGSGGTGKVYRAEYLLRNKDIALKVIGGFGVENEMLRAFLSEYDTQLRITDSSNILRSEMPLTCTYNNMKWILLPMELGEKTLRDWLRETKANKNDRIEEGLKYFKQICKGVQSLHNSGVIHLDLKPENVVLVRPDENTPFIAKIGDFGLARGLERALEHHRDLLPDGVGTPAYMAPEQILAAHWKDVGKESDIYALGMILYEILDGDLPYSGTAQQVKEKKLNTSIRIRKPAGPENLSALSLHCLERDIENRIQTTADIISALEGKSEAKEVEEPATEIIETRKEIKKKYAEYLSKIVVRNKVFWKGYIYENIDAIKIIQNDCVDRTTLYLGEIYVVADILSLLHNSFIEELKILLDSFSLDESDDITFIKYFAQGDREKSLYELEKASDVRDNFILYAYGFNSFFNDIERAKVCLKKAEAAAQYSSHWVMCSRACKDIVGDNDTTRRYLQKAEAGSEYTFDWLRCARFWKELLNADLEARRCIKEAERRAENSQDWNYCAQSWKMLFYDDAETRRCLQIAEGLAKNSGDWISCSRAWKELYDNDNEVRTCLKKAEDIAENSWDWMRCAISWKEFLNYDIEARRLLKRAEDDILYPFEWRDLAISWRELMNDEREAMRCESNA